MGAPKWWQKAVFYQIYPRSFVDSNGDGIGDLEGIRRRLDYLQDLGVDALWLCPHYPSPLVDWGYDVADYMDVAPEYGTLADFRRLLDEAHRRNIRVILDLVLNHTSDQHPWFLESRASRENPKRDWYIWRDGKDGGPPNNWYSIFGGSAWEYDPRTGQYYYHFFFKEQPDLNWRNPAVKRAMFDVVRFWLDMGVDGFRLDAVGTLFEDPGLPDQTAPMSYPEWLKAWHAAADEAERARLLRIRQEMFRYQEDLPEVHAVMRELRALVETYGDKVLVGETEDLAYYGNGDDELHLVFNFPLMKAPRLTPAVVRANQRERLGAMPPGAWPCNTMGNHDFSRVLSRYGDGRHDLEIARIAAALMLTLKGTPFLYYGEEIGMRDLLLTDLAQFKDPLGRWWYQVEREHFGTPHEEAVARAAAFGRDKCRTPMQWSRAPHAGFCPPEVSPWLPVHPNFAEGVNVADQWEDPRSLLQFYRRLIHLRRRTPALVLGDYLPLAEEEEEALLFLRRLPDDSQAILVAMNMGEGVARVATGLEAHGRWLFSTHRPEGGEGDLRVLTLAPFEISIAEVQAPPQGSSP
ncbi:MAG: glucohydrolase [Thermoflexus sp.]|uniref:glycoside hydrolase family 13 protein n=1 Tax=Thermoflexus sp. TaxID=1969742 RepID=UPI00332A82C8